MTEESAGAVIVKRLKDSWHVLLIRDMKGVLTFPKGMMEKDEIAVETAMREAHEETRISGIRYQHLLGDVQYMYTREGRNIRKTVHYFLFVYEGDQQLIPQKEEGISDITWMPLEEAIESVGYSPSNKPILRTAQRILMEDHIV